MALTSTPPPLLGIRSNLSQFSLLVLVNGFVGAMVGMERSILPLIAEQEFSITSHSAILSFLVSFGIVKAFSNLLAGGLSDRIGRKKLLILGWIAGLPVPFMLMWAPSWSWILAANIFLGINQGLCWSTTVIMKIDIAGSKQRGLAMGLNEFAGYLAVAVAAFWSAHLAALHGLRPVPFYLGIGFSTIGLALSALVVKETRHFAHAEADLSPSSTQPSKTFSQIFVLTSWKSRSLFSISLAGLINNLNDGLVWGTLPIILALQQYNMESIGFVVGLYPATWGSLQIVTGSLSDRFGRKWMIVVGMSIQAIAIWIMGFETHFQMEVFAAILLGLGTAMVYPTLLAAVGDQTDALWRASAVGVYRLWRDLGYAAGAILSGVVADMFGISAAFLVVGVLTMTSGIVVAVLYPPRR